MIEEAITQAKDDLDEDSSDETAGDHGEMVLSNTCRLRLALTPQKFFQPTGKVVDFSKSIFLIFP